MLAHDHVDKVQAHARARDCADIAGTIVALADTVHFALWYPNAFVVD